MEIVSFKKIKGNMYEVLFDNKEKYQLYEDIILKYELLIYKKIDKKTFTQIILENELIIAYYKALKYISIKMRTEKEIENYLKKAEMSGDAIIYAIDRLNKEGYLDQEKYVNAYIRDALNLSLDGPKKIIYFLSKLGINQDIIYKYLDQVTENEWISRIQKVVDKKALINKSSLPLFKKKMFAYLSTLGYHSDTIKSVLDSFKLDTSLAFKKEATKIWSNLEKKYLNEELKRHFKNKMYQKGYSSEEITNYLNKIN